MQLNIFTPKTNNILISIHPQYVEKIVSGEKKVEFRRRFTNKAKDGDVLWIYTTVPEKKLGTKASIKTIHYLPIHEIVRRFGSYASSNSMLSEYYSGLENGYVIELHKVKTFTPIPLNVLKECHINPPQGIRFLSQDDMNKLNLVSL